MKRLEPLGSLDLRTFEERCAYIPGSGLHHYTCAQPGLTISPRVVAIPVFDLELYLATGGPGNGTVKIVNILGFFVDRYSAGTVTGYLINKKGSYSPGGGGVAGPASFLKMVLLIR